MMCFVIVFSVPEMYYQMTKLMIYFELCKSGGVFFDIN